MVSSLTAEGALITLEALSLGAVDFIAKPTAAMAADWGRSRAQLVAKVRVAAATGRPGARLPARPSVRATRQPASAWGAAPARILALPGIAPGLVLVGVSTGGPRALERILPALPAGFPWPVLVAQHMPPTFTGALAKRLDGQSRCKVVEVTQPMPLLPGTIHIGAGDTDLVVEREGSVLVARPAVPDASPWHPSADRLVRTAMEALPAHALIGVLLTGMGNDGAAAMAELHQRGGRTIAEAEASCVVFGMPADLIRRGGATQVLPAERMAATLTEWLAGSAFRRMG